MPAKPTSSLTTLAEELGLHLKVTHTPGYKIKYAVMLSHDPEGEFGHWIQSSQPEIIRTWLRGYKSGLSSKEGGVTLRALSKQNLVVAGQQIAIKQLTEFAEHIAISAACCGSPECSLDEPSCDPKIARAVLQEVK